MKLYRVLPYLLLAGSVAVLSACPQNQENSSSEQDASVSVSASETIDEASGVVTEEETVRVEETSAGDASAAVVSEAGSLPAECETYIQTVTACVDKISGNNKVVADSLKQRLDQTREAWKKHDVTGLNEACSQLNKTFEQTAKSMGC